MFYSLYVFMLCEKCGSALKTLNNYLRCTQTEVRLNLALYIDNVCNNVFTEVSKTHACCWESLKEMIKLVFYYGHFYTSCLE